MGKLDEFSTLKSKGLELERQSYEVFSSVELWETRLQLTVLEQEIEVPVNGCAARGLPLNWRSRLIRMVKVTTWSAIQ